MKKKVTVNNTYCDICDIVLEHSGFCVSDLKAYPHHWIQIGDVDLCFKCAGKIFDNFYVKDISYKSLKDNIDVFKTKYNITSTDNMLFTNLDNAINNLTYEGK